jgi:hypothetical protein
MFVTTVNSTFFFIQHPTYSAINHKNVKGKVVSAHVIKAYRRSRNTAPLILDLGSGEHYTSAAVFL